MKRILIAGILLCAFSMTFGCGEKKVLHCDRCGNEVTYPLDSNVTEDWIIVCNDCRKELYP